MRPACGLIAFEHCAKEGDKENKNKYNKFHYSIPINFAFYKIYNAFF